MLDLTWKLTNEASYEDICMSIEEAADESNHTYTIIYNEFDM